MRRLAAAPLLAAVLVGGLLAPFGVAGADEPGTTRSSPTAPMKDLGAASVLAEAEALLGGAPGIAARGAAPVAALTGHEATLVLRDLRLALLDLDPADRRTARSILARPTDGDADPLRQGYDTRSQKRCGGKFCVHHVTKGADRAKGAWVRKTLRVMNRVWKQQVGDLGYRPPLSDGPLPASRNGGNGKFDVYLADIGAQSLYGYCAADFRVRSQPRRAGGYCVLDNDFSTAEFNRPPKETLEVTAAHEFFHAIQFGYDYFEDRWFLESTATWMEERFADDVDDNRQYLRFGQVERPDLSLDLFDRGGFTHYGNWAFWEHLSERYGLRVVRSTWEAARGGKRYSTSALGKVLEKKGGLTKRYAGFAAANLTPAESYPEGDRWRPTPLAGSFTLRAEAVREVSTRLDHLASASYLFTPDATLMPSDWRLRLKVDGPSRSSSPTAWVVVRTRDGAWDSRQLALSKRGRGTLEVPFSSRDVEAVSVTLVNASTRYRCDQDVQDWSCYGIPRDEDKPFELTAEVRSAD